MARFGVREREAAAAEARVRFNHGRLVHSVVVELESARAGSAHELSDAIEEIEAVGWSLDRLEPAMSAASHARPLILLVFRRA